jgi:hypothetical protein
MFKCDIENKIKSYSKSITSVEELEFESKKLSEDIGLCLKNNTSIKLANLHKTIIPKELLKMIKTKKQLRRIYSIAHDPAIKNVLNNISNKIKRFNKKLLEEHWNQHCAYLATKKPSEQVYWQVIKKIESGTSYKSTTILSSTKRTEEKVKQFSDFYEQIFQNNFSDRNFENIFQPDPQEFAKISIDETLSAINSSKSTNSTGIDGLSFKVMKSSYSSDSVSNRSL